MSNTTSFNEFRNCSGNESCLADTFNVFSNCSGNGSCHQDNFHVFSNCSGNGSCLEDTFNVFSNCSGNGSCLEDTFNLFTNCSGNGSCYQDNETSTSTTDTAECSNEIEVLVTEYLWKTIPPILFVLGVTGNILAIIILRRLGQGKQPTLTFLSFLALSDTVVLFTGLPRYWISYTFHYDIRRAGNANCKLYYFVIYLSMQYSSWILVGVATERLVKTYFPFRYKRFYTSKKVSIGLLVTLFLLVLVNGHFFFTNGINEFTKGYCSSLNANFLYFDEEVFVYIDFCLLSAVPFTLMLISNILVVRILKAVQRSRVSMMHDSMVHRANRFSVRMTKMLLVCTFYFIISTAPISVYFILDTYLTPVYESSYNCDALARMDIVWAITYLIQFSNYCINFYLYTAMNDRFCRELTDLVLCRRSIIRGSIRKTTGQTTRNLARQSLGSVNGGLEETFNSFTEENQL